MRLLEFCETGSEGLANGKLAGRRTRTSTAAQIGWPPLTDLLQVRGEGSGGQEGSETYSW